MVAAQVDCPSMHSYVLSMKTTISEKRSTLRGVWGSSATNVFVSGTNGRLVRFDGTNWNTLPRRTSVDFTAFTGAGSDAFAFGDATAVQTAGNLATRFLSTPTLNSVWAVDANTAFAVGQDGAIWRYSNGTSHLQQTGTLGPTTEAHDLVRNSCPQRTKRAWCHSPCPRLRCVSEAGLSL